MAEIAWIFGISVRKPQPRTVVFMDILLCTEHLFSDMFCDRLLNLLCLLQCYDAFGWM